MTLWLNQTESQQKDQGKTTSTASRMLTCSRQFGNDIFTLYVGPEKQTFTAHSEVLSRSLVLKRMCKGPFLESETKIINLPDDDADLIELMLDCLYASRYAKLDLNFMKKVCHKTGVSLPKELAELYIVAEKYQLEGIQHSIVVVYADMQIQLKNFTMFLMVTGRIYNNIATSCGPFPCWFRTVAEQVLKRATPNQLRAFRDLVREGDDLAADIFTAMARAHGASIDGDTA